MVRRGTAQSAVDGARIEHDGLLVDDYGFWRMFTLDRVARRNALTTDLVTVLAEEVGRASRDHCRAVVITGRGAVFCAGGDLPSLWNIAREAPTAATEAIYDRFHGLVRSIRDCSAPVIAAVNGPALGAGLDLALACDLRLADPAAVFESTWVRVGLVPGMGGAHFLPGLIGAARSAELLLLGRRISATTALDWGLINDIADEGSVTSLAAEMSEGISRLPRLAVERTKQALRRARDHGLEPELAVLGALQGQLLASPDFEVVARRFVKEEG